MSQQTQTIPYISPYRKGNPKDHLIAQMATYAQARGLTPEPWNQRRLTRTFEKAVGSITRWGQPDETLNIGRISLYARNEEGLGIYSHDILHLQIAAYFLGWGDDEQRAGWFELLFGHYQPTPPLAELVDRITRLEERLAELET